MPLLGSCPAGAARALRGARHRPRAQQDAVRERTRAAAQQRPERWAGGASPNPFHTAPLLKTELPAVCTARGCAEAGRGRQEGEQEARDAEGGGQAPPAAALVLTQVPAARPRSAGCGTAATRSRCPWPRRAGTDPSPGQRHGRGRLKPARLACRGGCAHTPRSTQTSSALGEGLSVHLRGRSAPPSHKPGAQPARHGHCSGFPLAAEAQAEGRPAIQAPSFIRHTRAELWKAARGRGSSPSPRGAPGRQSGRSCLHPPAQGSHRLSISRRVSAELFALGAAL